MNGWFYLLNRHAGIKFFLIGEAATVDPVPVIFHVVNVFPGMPTNNTTIHEDTFPRLLSHAAKGVIGTRKYVVIRVVHHGKIRYGTHPAQIGWDGGVDPVMLEIIYGFPGGAAY